MHCRCENTTSDAGEKCELVSHVAIGKPKEYICPLEMQLCVCENYCRLGSLDVGVSMNLANVAVWLARGQRVAG